MGKNTNRPKVSSASKTTVKQVGYSTDNKKPIWCFDMIDRNSKFAFDVDRADFRHYEVIKKIIDYSNMTWAEIERQTHDDGKSKHHFLSLDTLSKEAITSFNKKELSDRSDSIFSFSFQNKLRIVGIRIDEYFHVVWYDPNHEVCPSHKKHT